ncbi:hypothetical protein [Pontibacter actiniarum]|uniref:hypothetical protein n=1 Tax=Pontibacter actiniarum TaxID=323450 RepID=UPI0004226E8B|nr:hypothetical protein [Pontibacter actiniarum]
MKHYLFILILCCALTTLGSTAALAQEGSKQERRENVEAAKTAFLTDKMELTAEQAQKFWPLYNEYESKRRTLVKGYRSGYRENVEELSEQEAKTRLDNMFVIKERELNLEKEYANKYLRIISSKQLIKLYRGEREFTKMLLKRLDDRSASN